MMKSITKKWLQALSNEGVAIIDVTQKISIKFAIYY